MAYFAQFDHHYVAIQVIKIDDNDAQTIEAGVAFCQSIFGHDTVWLPVDNPDVIGLCYNQLNKETI